MKMKFNCAKCGKFICKLDLRKPKNKEEAFDMSNCAGCSKKLLDFARSVFDDNPRIAKKKR
jgi:DNA-directed RNA polymerase subunit RPC12/RpoP